MAKNKHLTFDDRCVIHEFLNFGYNFTQIANRIHKDRNASSCEVLNDFCTRIFSDGDMLHPGKPFLITLLPFVRDSFCPEAGRNGRAPVRLGKLKKVIV